MVKKSIRKLEREIEEIIEICRGFIPHSSWNRFLKAIQPSERDVFLKKDGNKIHLFYDEIFLIERGLD